MARIRPVVREKLDAGTRQAVERLEARGRDSEMARTFAHLPELFRRYFDFFYPAHEEGVVKTRVKELARLRIAQLNDCLSCGLARYASAARQGLDEAKIAELELQQDERSFTPREALAVEFAERMARDHASVDQAFLARLRAQFGDAEVLELGMMIAQYIAMGRLLVVLGLHHGASELYDPRA